MLPVQLFAKSRIFNRLGVELGRDDVVPDLRTLVDGVLIVSDEDLIRSPLVILADPVPGESVLEGEIVAVDLDEQSLLVHDGTLDRCVQAADANIFLINDDDGLSSTRGELADLAPGQEVVVFGGETIDGCVAARTILADD
jgi:hypothetical protein